jgi:hypothetical protein
MNTRANLTVVALLTSFALASNPAKADVLGFSVGLPTISALTAEVGRTISADATAYLRNALSEPRIIRKRQSPTVTVRVVPVSETAGIETVTVAASRLPAIETVTVVATRLPAVESLAMDASRAPQDSSRTRL